MEKTTEFLGLVWLFYSNYIWNFTYIILKSCNSSSKLKIVIISPAINFVQLWDCFKVLPRPFNKKESVYEQMALQDC